MRNHLLAGASLLALVAWDPGARAAPFDFTFTGSLVTFTVPVTGTYRILAFGAQGGDGAPGMSGLGGDFSLTAGEVLQIAVGGPGGQGDATAAADRMGAGGGGGGSFVVGPSNMPLAIAGGGGGGGGPRGGGGGGGGYSGGGGGGSYDADAGSTRILMAGVRSGDGEVMITFVFAGTPGSANCLGKGVSALARENGGLSHAAAALGYASVQALQNAISAYCADVPG